MVPQDYKEYHDNMNVHFIVTLGEKDMEKAEAQGLVEFFKLTSKINTSNMMCFDFDGKIKKYNSPEEIIEDFYPVRLEWYQKRKVSEFTNLSEGVRLILIRSRTTWPASCNWSSRGSPIKLVLFR